MKTFIIADPNAPARGALKTCCPPWATRLTRSLPLSSPFGPTFRLVYLAPAPALDCLKSAIVLL